MRKICSAIVLWGVLFSAAAAVAQDKARAIVEKAIQAQGGEAKMAKLRIMRIKVEGTTDLVPGQFNLPFTLEDVWQMPNQYKTSASFQLPGQKLTQTQAVDGEKGWIQMNGQTQDLPKEAMAEMKEQKYAEDLDRLGFLKERSIDLSVLDEIKVNGTLAVGVLVKSQGHRDVRLYFDKTSGWLVKRAYAVLDPSSGKEVLQEVVFGDYQEKDGLKHYQKIMAYREGKKVIDAKVTEIEFFQKLDDQVFTKP